MIKAMIFLILVAVGFVYMIKMEVANGEFKGLKSRAEEGDPIAQYHLASAYNLGEKIKKNQEKAVKWYIKSAEQGLACSQIALAVCYESGTGVKKNQEKAVKWLKKAAKQDHSFAQLLLAKYYKNGVVVKKDLNEAERLYKKSASQNKPSNKKYNITYEDY